MLTEPRRHLIRDLRHTGNIVGSVGAGATQTALVDDFALAAFALP
jgi:hypothetical protein